MRMLGIMQWVACLALVIEPAAALGQFIDIFGVNPSTGQVDFGVCQGSVVPEGAPLRLSIYAHLGGRAPEMSGASNLFVFERGPNGENRNNIFVPVAQGGLGWSASSSPNSLAAVSVGDPFLATGTPPNTAQQRAAVAFDTCQHGDADAPPGYIRLYDVVISKSTPGGEIPVDTYLWIGFGLPPGEPMFNCPKLILCDAPTWTVVCVPGGQFIVNPSSRSCTVAVETKPWGSIKALYR